MSALDARVAALDGVPDMLIGLENAVKQLYLEIRAQGLANEASIKLAPSLSAPLLGAAESFVALQDSNATAKVEASLGKIENVTDMAVALFSGDTLVAGEYRLLGRGHAAALVPMIAALPGNGRANRIAVALGPICTVASCSIPCRW